MHVCMHVCRHVCMHVCMYACMRICMYACMHVCTCLRVCVCVCMYVCERVRESESAIPGEVDPDRILSLLPFALPGVTAAVSKECLCSSLWSPRNSSTALRRLLRFFLQLAQIKSVSCASLACQCCSVLQRVAACCSDILQCVAVCCSVLQCAAVCCSVLQCAAFFVAVGPDHIHLLHISGTSAATHSVLQCVAMCCSVV